ncbi:MAG: signal peptidase II [Candidatus Binatus sp.]|uniref:signal peptidase II n=1 Tax=Candidatus Binatus sp. TaxID=2811406 RepID=UPI00272028B5|nr:signal peptidase II [Candidatus Binatus sp.]MDO8433562.1 signal peptidase II [Candidatus Binatus sp.]
MSLEGAIAESDQSAVSANVAVATAPPRRSPMLLLILVTIPVLALDQASKLFVKAHMSLYQTIPLINHYVDLTYTQNPGAAFSMFAAYSPWFREAFLFSMSAAAIVVLLAMLIRAERISITSIAFALILAGAAGNLIDRSVHGQVIDFIRLHYYDWSYPIFNVADSAISIGVVMIVLATFFARDDEKLPAAD